MVLDKVDQQLEQWAKEIVGAIEISFEAPGSEAPGHHIGIYLFEILQTDRRVGGDRRIPLKFDLRYLITSWSQQPKQAHRALGKLLFTALGSVDYEVEMEPLASSFWTSFKCAPRPCFVLRVPIHYEFDEANADLVQEPPELRTSASNVLFGSVLGPRQTPISGATIKIPGLSQSAISNHKGEFRLLSVPADPLPSEVIVTAKGREHLHQLPAGFSAEQPLVIDFPISEKHVENPVKESPARKKKQ